MLFFFLNHSSLMSFHIPISSQSPHVVVACEDQSACELLDLEFTRHRSLPTYIFLQLLITKPFSLALLQVPCGQKTGLGLRVPSQCWWTLRE